MRISRSATYALGVLAAAALLAGCSTNGGSQLSGVAPSSGFNSTHVGIPQVLRHSPQDLFVGVKWTGNVHPDHQKSWISPDVKKAPRLYFAADSGTDDVYIFTMPDLVLKGTLTGFDEPQGECSDTAGNIYIANTEEFEVLKYSRTGTLLATYSDTAGYPVGCAVNPANGDLAVTNIFNTAGAGGVYIYTSPSSTPTELTNPSGYYYYFAGYGPGSSLWVSGRNASGDYLLSACGATTCSTISLSGGTVYFPGAVQYDYVASTWVVFDQLCGDTNAACSYPVSVSGALGTATDYHNPVGTNVCDLVQATIAANGAKYVAGGDYESCGFTTTSFDRWAYTAGGTPTNHNTSGETPIGAAVSTK
jgi:hypothetical protein